MWLNKQEKLQKPLVRGIGGVGACLGISANAVIMPIIQLSRCVLAPVVCHLLAREPEPSAIRPPAGGPQLLVWLIVIAKSSD